MKGTGIKNLPEGWGWDKIGSVINDSVPVFSPENHGEEKFFYIDISSIDNVGKKNLKSDQIFVKDAPSRAKSILKENDIAVALVDKNHNGHVCLD